jgi:hypothetical protein
MQIKELIDKLSSYNIFNYLLPGCLFHVILCKTTGIVACPELNVISVVFIYFEGLVVSRVGSIVIEELLWKHHKMKEINTKELLAEFQKNVKLEIIFEAMNMYRTLAAMFILLAFFSLVYIIVEAPLSISGILYIALEFILFVLFLFSFTKQRKKVLECLE